MKNHARQFQEQTYKAIICDVDGTLVTTGPTSLPSQGIKKAIANAQATAHVAIATSRNYTRANYLFAELGLTGPSAISGGAQIVDAKTHALLHQELLPKEDFHAVLNIFKKEKEPIHVVDNGVETIYSKAYVPHMPYEFFLDGITRDQALSLQKKLSHITTIATTLSAAWDEEKFCLGVSHVNATKEGAVTNIARLLGISTSEIIGIGDGYNDFPLLLACGLKIAMGNAVPELKEIADYIAPTVQEDGVAHVIETFLMKTARKPLSI